jgi:hypothetical protein
MKASDMIEVFLFCFSFHSRIANPSNRCGQSFMLQGRRRLEAAAAAGGFVPRSILAFSQLPN